LLWLFVFHSCISPRFVDSIKASSQIFADYLQTLAGDLWALAGDMAGESTLHSREKPTDPDTSSYEFLFSNRIYPNHYPLPPLPFHRQTTLLRPFVRYFKFSRFNDMRVPLTDWKIWQIYVYRYIQGSYCSFVYYV